MAIRAKPMASSDSSVRFEVSKDGSVIRVELLMGPVIRVGRVVTSGLRIEDERVDALHAIIEVKSQDEVFVSDLGSKSGTMLNGESIAKARVKSRDRLVFGDTHVEIFLGLDKTVARKDVPAPGVVAD